MLLDKPVAAFGLAEYSNAVINGHLEKLDEITVFKILKLK